MWYHIAKVGICCMYRNLKPLLLSDPLCILCSIWKKRLSLRADVLFQITWRGLRLSSHFCFPRLQFLPSMYLSLALELQLRDMVSNLQLT